MALIKVCRHGREPGLTPAQRMKRWRRCDCSWYAHIGKQRVNVGRDEDKARIEEARLKLALLRNGTKETQGPPSGFTAVANEWLALQEARPDSNADMVRKWRNWRDHTTAFFGDVRPGDITPGDVDEFLGGLAESLAPSTVGNIYSGFRSIMKHARKRGLLEVIPEPYEKHNLRSRPRHHRLRWDQAEAIIAAMPDDAWRAVAEFVMLTGLRIGETLRVQSDMLGPTGDVLFIPASKTENGIREIPLSPRAREVFDSRARLALPDHRLWLFTTSDANRIIHDALVKTGTYVKGRGWHTLRNVHAALLEASGVPLREAAERMGHGSNTNQTFQYGWAPERTPATELDAARERLRRHGGTSAA